MVEESLALGLGLGLGTLATLGHGAGLDPNL